MRSFARRASLALALTAGVTSRGLAESNLSRGIYAAANPALSTNVWSSQGDVSYLEQGSHGGTAAVRCVAPEPGYAGVSQAVQLDQPAPRPIRISGWSKAAGVAEGGQPWEYSLYVDLKYTDGEPLFMQLVPFAPGSHDWQYGELTVTPPKPVASASVHAFLRNRAGEVWFDDLFFGEPGGPNRLKAPGFEPGERIDLTARQALFDGLADLHCNALHTYLPDALADWDAPEPAGTPVADFLSAAARRGVGVWLTLGRGLVSIRDADDPNFPQYYCVNGPWGERWAANLARAARYPFAGISLVPDEYNWNNGHLQQWYEDHPDPRVKAFFASLGDYCPCPVCAAKFRQQTGFDLPNKLPSTLPSATDVWRHYLDFRYDSTTSWLQRTATAIRASNPRIELDSLICVTPLCSDFWYGPGIAWDRAGYEAGLEVLTTDPYIELHNYLGDSTHWYVSETAEHLAGASPARRCGIVLEASRLRPDYRELDPVETYGSALTAVWHGAEELAWWHYSHLTDQSHTTDEAPAAYARVKGVYELLERIDGWFAGGRPAPGIAFLFSRASCDWWRFYAQAEDRPAGVLGDHGGTDPRYAAVAQQELLYYLMRQGYPVTLYYLDSVRAEELAGHSVVMVPFPYAVSDAQTALLQEVVDRGQRLVVVSECGTLDEQGRLRPRPALLDLLSLRSAPGNPSERRIGAVRDGREVMLGTITEWTGLEPAAGGVAEPGAVLSHSGRVVFLAGEYGIDLAANQKHVRKTRAERILPCEVNQAVAYKWRRLLDDSGVEPLLQRDVDGDDLELALRTNAAGERLLLMVNWKSEPVTAPRPDGLAGRPLEAWSLDSHGRVAPRELAGPMVALDPQEAVVARFAP